MLSLRAIQADQGDCLILESGGPQDRVHVLIDGGPAGIYERHLRSELQEIGGSGGKIDLLILSHVDNDHVLGLRDLLAELEEQRANGDPETTTVEELWHNAFSKTLGRDNDLESRLETLISSSGAAMTSTGAVVSGIGEGDQVRRAAIALGIPINPGFPGDLVSVDEAQDAVVLGDLELRIVGPTEKNLEELRNEWLDWLDEHEESIMEAREPAVAAMADRSIPNLSSIMVLVQSEGRKVLLTGDGRGDHLLEGLGRVGVLDAEGRTHVDVLKVPHHGSARNVDKEFFETVTADTYVVSANGRDGNPDLDTLTWMVEAAMEQGREIEIVATNQTSSTEELVEKLKPEDCGYRLVTLGQDSNSVTVELVAP